MSSRGLPVLSSDAGLSRYLSEIRKFPLLTPEDEYMFAKRLKEHGDAAAAHKLVTSHLRLVAKIAMGYRGYGLPISEIVAEGNVGLMQAVKRFDPDKGFRLATYAMWWIRAAIQEYVLRSWSMVKMGTTAAQKKLFFNLRKAKSHIGAIEEGDLTPDHTATLADQLGVTEREVTEMNRRLTGPDASLNAPLRSESESEWQDWLADDTADQETRLAEREEMSDRHELLVNAMKGLTDRERDIIQARRLQDEPASPGSACARSRCALSRSSSAASSRRCIRRPFRLRHRHSPLRPSQLCLTPLLSQRCLRVATATSPMRALTRAAGEVCAGSPYRY